MNSTPPEPPRLLDRRKLLWWAFWFVLLSTPVCALFLPGLARRIATLRMGWGPQLLMCAAGCVAGAFAAGFLLAKLVTKTDGEFIARGISYGLALVAFYAIIGLAGCFLLIGR